MARQNNRFSSKRNNAVDIATFLAMFIFTLATSLTNPFYGMIEAAMAQSSSSTTSGYSCSVSLNCGDGTISCTGTSLCTRGNGWVACDGNYTYC